MVKLLSGRLDWQALLTGEIAHRIGKTSTHLDANKPKWMALDDAGC